MSEEVRVKLSDLPAGEAVRVEAGRYGICVVRLGEDVYALEDRCSHQDWLLSDGEVDVRRAAPSSAPSTAARSR